MKKQFIIFIFSGLMVIQTFADSVLSLRELSANSIFDSKNWNLNKGRINKQLIEERIPRDALVFRDLVLEDMDFSGMCLKNVEFINCEFNYVNFEDADLRDTRFEDCKFFKVKLDRALLADDFRFDGGLSHLELVYKYSELMNSGEIDKCKGLNKVLGPLQLRIERDLKYMQLDLSELNLTGINLQNSKILFVSLDDANLTNANLKNIDATQVSLKNSILIGADLTNAYLEITRLQNTYLSKNVLIAWDSLKLFKMWSEGTDEEKICVQKLVSTRVNIFGGLSNEVLRSIDWRGRDLRNANLCRAQLQGIDLSGVNLENALLYRINLQGSTLIDVNFTNANLSGAELQNARLSEGVMIPLYDNVNELFILWSKGTEEEKACVQKLVNAGVNIFDGLSNEILRNIDWWGRDLRNAGLSGARLQGIDLSGANLENAQLRSVNLEGSFLMRVNLKGAQIRHCNFKEADLSESTLVNSSIELSDFYKAIFKRSNLSRIKIGIKFSDELNFMHADFTGANFRDSVLENVNLNYSILTDTCLKNTDLRTVNLGGVKINETVFPGICIDNTLINEYLYCGDAETKLALLQILKARDVSVNSIHFSTLNYIKKMRVGIRDIIIKKH